MDSHTVIAQAPLSEVPHLELSEIALARFQAALDSCLNGWNCGEGTVVLQDNIPKLFGDFLLDFFKRTLLGLLGEGSDLTIEVGDDETFTRVQMSKTEPALPQVEVPPQLSQTYPSELTAIDTAALLAGMKKAPRPMNCWIIFRDMMHKKLKLGFPDLTVQEISTRCSQIWRNMSPKDKKTWRDAAQLAKEEHSRLHPDYKYSPRKPGQKKKRQSRKAKRAAAVATGPEVLNFQLAVPAATSDTATDSMVVSNTGMNDMGNMFTGFTEFNSDTGFPEFLAQGPAVDFVHDSESLRHDRLNAEFGNAEFDNAEFDNDFVMDMSIAMLGDDESFAFRNGANRDATLPPYLLDHELEV